MCVVEYKTYVYQGGQSKMVQRQFRCHNAPLEGLCSHVEERHTEAARVVERRPAPERLSSSRNIVTADGREYRYYPISRRSSNRSSMGRTGDNSGSRSPIDSLVSASPPRATMQRGTPPRAPSPPRRSSRRVSFHEAPQTRADMLGGTVVATEPPSSEMPRALVNERPALDRRSSISSLTNEIDDTEPPARCPSVKRPRRSSGLNLGLEGEDTASSSQSSPGLSDLPKIYRDHPTVRKTPSPGTLGRAPGDKQSAKRSSREEDERQARIVNEALAATERRQRDRLSRDMRQSARKHPEDLSRESSSETRSKQRRAAAAAPGGQSSASARQAEITREIDRKVEAEMEGIRRERAMHAERYRSEYHQQPQYSPTSPRTYTYMAPPPSNAPRSPFSARTMTDTSAVVPSARTPRYGHAVVHQPILPRDPLAEQGERVIMREQARASEASRRMAEMMENTQLYDEAYDDGTQDVGISSTHRTSGRRYRREDRMRRSDSFAD